LRVDSRGQGSADLEEFERSIS
jgi:hypothetical protein